MPLHYYYYWLRLVTVMASSKRRFVVHPALSLRFGRESLWWVYIWSPQIWWRSAHPALRTSSDEIIPSITQPRFTRISHGILLKFGTWVLNCMKSTSGQTRWWTSSKLEIGILLTFLVI